MWVHKRFCCIGSLRGVLAGCGGCNGVGVGPGVGIDCWMGDIAGVICVGVKDNGECDWDGGCDDRGPGV